MRSSGAAAAAASSTATSPTDANAAASKGNARAQASRINGARAAASRANGAKSRGPKTAEGKARVSKNALKHGLCAKKYLLLPGDSSTQFAALERALLDDLSPQGALQTLLAHRLIARLAPRPRRPARARAVLRARLLRARARPRAGQGRPRRQGLSHARALSGRGTARVFPHPQGAEIRPGRSR